MLSLQGRSRHRLVLDVDWELDAKRLEELDSILTINQRLIVEQRSRARCNDLETGHNAAEENTSIEENRGKHE